MDKFCNEANYRFFNALANRTRLAMIDSLKEKPRTATEVAQTLNIDQEASLQYLELMAGCMILHAEGLGKDKRYSLNREVLEPMGEVLGFHTSKYCPGLKRSIPEDKLKEHRRRESLKEVFAER